MVLPGARIGAIRNYGENCVFLFGFGVYTGDAVPPAEVDEELHRLEVSTPKLLLDDGSTVWGCECMWGPEARVRDRCRDREIVLVSIDTYREVSASYTRAVTV